MVLRRLSLLLVGASYYPFLTEQDIPSIRPLVSAARSAARLAEWLVRYAEQYGRDLRLFVLLSPSAEEKDEVSYVQAVGRLSKVAGVTLGEATSVDFLRVGEEWRADGRNAETLSSFAFIGHGFEAMDDPAGDRPTLLLADLFQPGVTDRAAVDFRAFQRCLAERGAGKQIFFLDTCRRSQDEYGPRIQELTPTRVLTEPTEPDPAVTNAVVFFAALRDQCAWETTPLSIYTRSLIEALNQGGDVDFTPGLSDPPGATSIIYPSPLAERIVTRVKHHLPAYYADRPYSSSLTLDLSLWGNEVEKPALFYADKRTIS